MVNEKAIRNQITKEVFPLFGQGKFNESVPILQKMYLQYCSIVEEIETKRMIKFHLGLAKYSSNPKDIEGAKLIIDELKRDMESIERYKDEYVVNYNKVLSLYCLIHDEDISLNEKVKIHQQILDGFEKINFQGDDKFIELFNINYIQGKYDNILFLITELHNNGNDRIANNMVEQLNELKSKKWYNKAKKLTRENNLIII